MGGEFCALSADKYKDYIARLNEEDFDALYEFFEDSPSCTAEQAWDAFAFLSEIRFETVADLDEFYFFAEPTQVRLQAGYIASLTPAIIAEKFKSSEFNDIYWSNVWREDIDSFYEWFEPYQKFIVEAAKNGDGLGYRVF
jgi:hypothetical protein